MIHASHSALKRFESAVVFAVDCLRVVLHFEERWVSTTITVAINLSVQDVNGSEYALFPNGHGFVVQSRLITLQIRLAHMGLTLHQI